MLVIQGLGERGVLGLEDNPPKLDLHFYYPERPCSIVLKNGDTALLTHLLIYSQNSESFINYKFWAQLTKDGFKCKNTLDDNSIYLYMNKVLSRIYSKYEIIEILRNSTT